MLSHQQLKVRMVVGLRKSWEKNAFREEPPAYRGQPNVEPQGYFAQEPLEVYQADLSFMRWFNELPGGSELSSRLYRQVDKAGTSVFLNIAEAYARTGAADRLRFLEMAEGSAESSG